MLDQHCADVGRHPSDIERSAGAKPTNPDYANNLHASGATFITLGFDGQNDYDLAPVADWLSWRDEKNAG